MTTPRYKKLLTPEEYAKLTVDEQAEYIVDMATYLKSLPAPHPPPGESDPTQSDPATGNAPNSPQDDPPAGNAPNPPQDDPPASNDKPKE